MTVNQYIRASKNDIYIRIQVFEILTLKLTSSMVYGIARAILGLTVLNINITRYIVIISASKIALNFLYN